jgi:Cu/Ag efflux protein CusF
MTLPKIITSFGLALGLALACHASGAQTALTEAEVRKVDLGAQKITLKHGEITNLNMPPMTMVFAVKDAALLDRIKAGDHVLFSAEKVNGAYTVTRLDLAPR